MRIGAGWRVFRARRFYDKRGGKRKVLADMAGTSAVREPADRDLWGGTGNTSEGDGWLWAWLAAAVGAQDAKYSWPWLSCIRRPSLGVVFERKVFVAAADAEKRMRISSICV